MAKKLELSPRLQTVADLVPEGTRLVDVGTDHAYLPVSLLLEGRIRSAVATDLRRGPLDRAQQTAQNYHCTDRMAFRLCDGLKDVRPDEADTIAIAGMGGETIIGILSAAKWVKENNLTVILQPMSTQPELRKWLSENGYTIRTEKLVREGVTLYNVMKVSAGTSQSLTPAQEWAGIQEKGDVSPLRSSFLEQLIIKTQRALDGAARSREGCAGVRYQELRELLSGLKDMKEEWDSWQV